ncbi:MAG: transporter substrate-binding domain-containing protein, partial [Defluviitaleaceae bacterium]|nr:transporter substrate-binding domain-containing protein [Defluviitaleaceae bacterium]
MGMFTKISDVMIRPLKKIFCLVFSFFFVCLPLHGCGGTDKIFFAEPVIFTSLDEIPGITAEDIAAVDALAVRYGSFVYGMPLSAELYTDEHGNLNGFTVLMCEWLSVLFGIKFEPALFEWLDLLDGLETGAVSFTGELTKTPARELIYNMTSTIATRSVKIYRLADSVPLWEISASRPLRCGFIKNSATLNIVSGEMAPDSYEVVELDDINQVYGALASGKIDAFYYSAVMEIHFAEYDNIVISDFYPLTFMSVSLSTQDAALSPVIEIVEKVLNNGGLHYLADMYNEARGEYRLFKLHSRFTDEEKEFIQNSVYIPVGVDPANYPGCFYDFREGEWGGIFLDVLDEVSLLTGLEFRRVNDEFTEWAVIYSMLENGQVALVPELTQTADRQDRFIWPDTPQMTEYYVLISHLDFPDLEYNEILYARVGLAQNTIFPAVFKKWFPD